MDAGQSVGLKERIVEILRQQPGTFVSGQDLSRQVGVSRSVLWKKMGELREMGHPIEARPRMGYAWLARGSPLARTRILGNRVLHFMKVKSTNDVARELLAREPAVEGTVVIADEQTAGRGRAGRSWVSPRGGLWFSIVFRPGADMLPAAHLLGMIAAVAGAVAINEVTGLVARLKWPNDILIDGFKVGGVLSELHHEGPGAPTVIVGTGINVNFSDDLFPSELLFNATTLKTLLNRDVPLSRLLAVILEQTEKLYTGLQIDGSSVVLHEWKRLNCTLGRGLVVSTTCELVIGRAVDVDELGRLVVDVGDGNTVVVDTGDIIRQEQQTGRSAR